MRVSLEKECVMDRPREESGVRASGGVVPGLEVCLCVVKGEQVVWGGGAESVQKNYLLGW